jgi:hypothetical protein
LGGQAVSAFGGCARRSPEVLSSLKC